jgi:hypothetical protein
MGWYGGGENGGGGNSAPGERARARAAVSNRAPPSPPLNHRLISTSTSTPPLLEAPSPSG